MRDSGRGGGSGTDSRRAAPARKTTLRPELSAAIAGEGALNEPPAKWLRRPDEPCDFTRPLADWFTSSQCHLASRDGHENLA